MHSSMLRTLSLPRLLAGTVFLGSVFASASATAAAPDLRATTVGGPGQVNADSKVLATIKIDNLGDALTGDYLAEVVLSQDLLVDAADPVVATITSDFIGSQSVLCTIPWGMADVPHIWGLRVTIAGDSDVTNNWTLGPFVNVLFVDLALDDPAPISAAVHVGGPTLDAIPVTVSNAGTVGSIVVFAVEKLVPAPWLTINAPNSFAVGGLPGNDVLLMVDHAGLTPGLYSTTLRFQDSYYPADFEDLEVTLTVGSAVFNPGDKIFGQIAGTGDQDRLEFDAVKGMKLVLRIRSSSGDLKPILSVVDPSGDVSDFIKLKHSKKTVKKVLKIKSSGRYALQIEGAPGTEGGYAIRSHRRLPKTATAHVRKFKGLDAGATGIVPTLMLPGGTMEYSVIPNSKFEGPVALGMTIPSGVSLDLSSSLTTTAAGTLLIEGLEVNDDSGEFQLAVGGFGGGAKEKVKVLVLPWQPQQGHGKVYID